MKHKVFQCHFIGSNGRALPFRFVADNAPLAREHARYLAQAGVAGRLVDDSVTFIGWHDANAVDAVLAETNDVEVPL